MQSGLLYYSDASFELFTVQVTLMVVKKKKLAMSKAMWRRFFYTHSTCCDEYSHGKDAVCIFMVIEAQVLHMHF